MKVKNEKDEICALLEVVRSLRAPDGCPWDRAQTHKSLTRYLIEETYEVLDAIERGDAADLCEELGDLLLQVLFHAELAREEGHFDIGDVAAEESAKMIRRHPHVFGNASAEETLSAWEQNKSAEKQRNTLTERLLSVPKALPALLRAQKLLDKCEGRVPGTAFADHRMQETILSASRVGDTADGEAAERAAGEFLLSAVEVFRCRGIDCEAALSQAIRGIFRQCEGL